MVMGGRQIMRRGYDCSHAVPDGLAVLTARPAPLYGPAGCNVFGPKPNDDANGMHQRYDAWNRLATVHWDDGDDANQLDANDTLRATCRYDGLNRRVRKIVVGDDANHTTEHIYHNTGWQVLEIRRGLEGAAPTASAYKEYAWDLRYIDAPICRWWDADADGQMEPTAGEQHYYTNDAQFSATALIDANSGAVVERYMYDPYGKPTFLDANWTPIPASAYENEILYCGYRYDPETGLCQVRNRYYNWLLGRWMTADPIGYADGPSLYEYCRSSPVGHSDSSGLAEGVDSFYLESLVRRVKQVHKGKLHYKPSGLARMFPRLLGPAIDQVDRLTHIPRVLDYYHLTNTVNLHFGASGYDAIHELIHALDDRHDWFLDRLLPSAPDISASEGLAYGTVALLKAFEGFARGMESEYTANSCRNAQEEWLKYWRAADRELCDSTVLYVPPFMWFDMRSESMRFEKPWTNTRRLSDRDLRLVWTKPGLFTNH
jgi:RHS repeat-associated protein